MRPTFSRVNRSVESTPLGASYQITCTLLEQVAVERVRHVTGAGAPYSSNQSLDALVGLEDVEEVDVALGSLRIELFQVGLTVRTTCRTLRDGVQAGRCFSSFSAA